MSMPTPQQLVSRYLFNTDTPPVNLENDALIRDKDARGTPIQVDAVEFMKDGGGRFADVALQG